ncbi:putative short-chain dehydrogenase [Xylariaceae sp. FL1651]|nr:putative short-chain dehydrogenase [Xylariaceae sp. FL1651]
MSSPFDPYAEEHKAVTGPGDQRPTALKILEDNGLIQAWSDKVVLITGATSGVGIETARAMYATGAKVFVMVRDTKKMQPIVADILKSTKGTGDIDVIEMDLESLDSVRNAAKQFLDKSPKLNVLINNAGIMMCPKALTVDGFERQFGVNYLAHFTLTMLLLPTMVSSSSATFNSRVVWVSSSAHRYPDRGIDFDDIGGLKNYDPMASYGQSKLAMIWASNYLDRTYGPRGVHSLSLNPGGVWTNLGRYATPETMDNWKSDTETIRQMKSPEQGAATQVWAAAAPVWEGKGGKYLADCKLAESSKDLSSVIDGGYGEHAYDPVKEEKLWKLSLEMAKLETP